MRRGCAAGLCLLVLTACAAPQATPYIVAETRIEVGGLNGRVAFLQSLPAIEVRRADGTQMPREAWVLAEDAARAHCADRGATYAPLPAARDYTQIRLDDGVFHFMARCQR